MCVCENESTNIGDVCLYAMLRNAVQCYAMQFSAVFCYVMLGLHLTAPRWRCLPDCGHLLHVKSPPRFHHHASLFLKWAFGNLWHIAMEKKWAFFIVELPIKMVIFHSCVNVYQRVDEVTRWCPPVVSWVIIPITIDIDISAINHSYWSYKPT